MSATIQAYARNDGGKGIRNLVAVAYTIECARHVSQRITASFDEESVQLFGWSGRFAGPDFGGDLSGEARQIKHRAVHVLNALAQQIPGPDFVDHSINTRTAPAKLLGQFRHRHVLMEGFEKFRFLFLA